MLGGRAADDGTQLVSRTGSNGGSLRQTGITSAVLTTGLFDVSLSIPLFPSSLKFDRDSELSLPGRNSSAHDGPSPCGSLKKPVNTHRSNIHLAEWPLTLVEDLVVVLDRLD